jgi:hypothetical protein
LAEAFLALHILQQLDHQQLTQQLALAKQSSNTLALVQSQLHLLVMLKFLSSVAEVQEVGVRTHTAEAVALEDIHIRQAHFFQQEH